MYGNKIRYVSQFYLMELCKENQMIQTFWMEPSEIEVELCLIFFPVLNL